MTEVSMTPSIGRDLLRLRTATKKSQGRIVDELRTKFDLRIDTSRLSRIESGRVTPNEVEVDSILQAIGTPEAEDYRQFHQASWTYLAKPPFWHADRPALAQAEETLQRLSELEKTLDPESPLRPQLELYRKTIRDSEDFLRDVTHDVVSIGRIGVGKTTAANGLTGLVLRDTSLDLEDRMVLETGLGHTTIGEVVVCQRREYAIRIEPYTESEIRQLVRDYCAALFSEAAAGGVQDEREEGVGVEIERALRNMAGFKYRQEEGEGQQRTRTEAVESLKDMVGTDERRTAFMNRLDLPRRTVTLLRHDPSQDQSPLDWIKKTSQKINNGLLPDVSLPCRIEIQMPDRILGDQEYDLRWVDTKGVDETAIRPDLQKRLEDPRSLLVLCSGFAEAPGDTAQNLIEHAVETGLRAAVDHRTVILALARDREARGMKDPTTLEKVKTDLEGYDEKARQVSDSGIYRKYALKVPILFLNAASEADCQAVTEQLRDAVRRMRRVHVEQIARVAETVTQVKDNLRLAETEAAQRAVNHQLHIFLENNADLAQQTKQVFMVLIDAVRTIHAQSVKASVRRRGDWHNLNVHLYLGTGAAQEARVRSDLFFNRLEAILSQMLNDPKLTPTYRFLEQLKESATTWRYQFDAKVRQMGREIFVSALEDADVWQLCLAQRAPDYRGKVAQDLLSWFRNVPVKMGLLQALEQNIKKEWERQVLNEFRKLCEQVGPRGT